MSCGAVVPARVRFSPPPPAGRSPALSAPPAPRVRADLSPIRGTVQKGRSGSTRQRSENTSGRKKARRSLRLRVASRSGSASREGEAVQDNLERRVVAIGGFLDLVGVGLPLEDDDHRATGGAGGGDHDLVGGNAGDPGLAHLVSLGETGLHLI